MSLLEIVGPFLAAPRQHGANLRFLVHNRRDRQPLPGRLCHHSAESLQSLEVGARHLPFWLESGIVSARQSKLGIRAGQVPAEASSIGPAHEVLTRQSRTGREPALSGFSLMPKQI
jgi:hypothetical protein